MGQINVFDKMMTEKHKRRKYENQVNFTQIST